MNKTAIKNFAVWARQKLISESIYKAGLVGITEKEILAPLPQSQNDIQFFDIGTGTPIEVKGSDISKRNALATKITEKAKETDYKTAFEFVIEEVAYTWFNRLIAIRFMEVNEYLLSGIRVLSSETDGKNEPDIVTNPFDTDIDFSDKEKDLIWKLKDENKLDELFRFLFIKQCNKLNEVLPNLFEKTNNYTELLLSISFTDTDGVLRHLVNDIDEADFKEAVEIIGWLYQYYNTEPKADVFAGLKKNVKITKDKIPAATQLFTPDWIVRYMVENSLGRIAVEKFNIDAKSMGWKYYLEEAEQTEEVQTQLKIINSEKATLEELKVIDPCMGSGHILVYAFDVLMQIYESQGYTSRDAVASIMENNLFGLDIDERAYQLSYFALMMKARANDRRFLTREIAPQVYCPKGYADGEEYGSLLNVEKLEEMPQMPEIITFDNMNYEQDLNTWNFRRLLNQKYDVVVTNPPYMGSKGMSAKLSKYVQDNYADSKSDMFAVFIERGFTLTKKNGFSSMITMESWMFLSSFEKMRNSINLSKTIYGMVHMPYLGKGGTSLGINFGTAATIFRNCAMNKYNAQYNYICYYETDEDGVPFEFPTINERYKTATQENFSKIPGSPIAYWVSEKMLSAFENFEQMEKSVFFRQGMATSDNNRFLKSWFEVNIEKISFTETGIDTAQKNGLKWFPYNKGGEFRKWYGNNELVVNWENDGKEMKAFTASLPQGMNVRLKSREYYFKEGFTWSALTSGNLSVRYSPVGYIFDTKGSMGFPNKVEEMYYLIGLLNSHVSEKFLKILAPTLDFNLVSMKLVPTKVEDIDIPCLKVQQNISLSKTDWDSFETSWDFVRHPLRNFGISLPGLVNTGTKVEPIPHVTHIENENSDIWKMKNYPNSFNMDTCYKMWEEHCQKRFNTLKQNEEELNRIFIDIYGLQDELTPEVEDKDVTVRLADKTRDIKSFISYAVGCMFGRYSIDVDGLAYAGGEFDNSKYSKFIPDADNVIPITDEEYFGDDIVGRFVQFVKVVYGEETVEENLDFIASALTNKGNTSREVIRNYFLKDFYKDHVKTYQKRPIYWLYDSGKQDGFKALVYMHRYNADTTGLLRVDYLHKIQRTYENEIEHMKDNIVSNHDIAKSTKRMEKLIKQLQETKEYDEKIAYLALSRIEIDLDDGVKVNYEKVQTGQDGKKLEVLGKV